MEKAKKKQLKKHLSWGCLALVVLFLAVMPLLATPEEGADGPRASILTGTAQTGSVEVAIRGGGNLTAVDAEDITLPSGVKITEFLVKNGDIVTEGTPLAAVDKVTLMEAIVQVQDTLEYLQDEMVDVKDDTISSYITATAGGRVKKVYAQAGESVQEVMLRDGALAVLSLDGLMAVQIERNMPITTGETVCVTFDDDTEVSGRVESNLNGKITITVDDEGYAIGEKVTVTTEDGDRVGSGELYVHNAWNATGFTGTISTVSAKEESTVYSGSTLFTLTDTEYTAELERLADEHREYEELLLEMFEMYQSGAILAPCDGKVSGIDEESVHLLAAEDTQWEAQLLNAQSGGEEKGWKIVLLSDITEEEPSLPEQEEDPFEDIEQAFPSAPETEIPDFWVGVCTRDETCTAEVHFRHCPMADNGEDTPETVYTGWAAQVISVDAENGITWVLKNPNGITVTDPADPPAIDTSLMTEVTSFTGTTYSDGTAITVGDTILMLDGGGIVKLAGSASSGGAAGEGTPGEGTTGDLSGIAGIMGGMGGMGSMGGMTGMAGAAVQAPVFEPYPLEGSTLMTVTPQERMSLTISLDEQDIAKIHPGQTAEVKVNALRGEIVEAEVTEVAISGTNNGGSSKFTVELTMPMAENMLAGMSATVSIPLYTKMDVLTIPVAALVENGAQTQVYTALAEETGEPSNPVPVTVGVSDGETAEILSGLEKGDTVYYSYYDTLELSTEVERGIGFSFG